MDDFPSQSGADLDLDSRFRWALATLRELRAQDAKLVNVFDIGSGSELLRDPINAMGFTYTSFDLTPEAATVKRWDVEERFPYSGSADVVLMLEIIEHLNNPWLSLRNVADTIKPGGYLVMSTPNPAWSGSRFTTLARGVPAMFTQRDLDSNHHVFTPWRHIIQRLLEDSGLEVLRVVQLGKKTSITAYPFWGIKLPVRLGFRVLKKIIERIDPVSIGALYGIVARKGHHAQ